MLFYLKLIDRLNKILLYLVGILMIVMVFSITYQVLVRMLFPKIGLQVSAPWAGELPLHCMIWLIFLGAAIATRHNKLISVDILQTSLSTKWAKVATITALILSMIFYIGILIAGYYWAMFGLTETSTSMGIKMFYVYVSMPVAAIVMILNTVAHVVNDFIISGEHSLSDDDLAETTEVSV